MCRHFSVMVTTHNTQRYANIAKRASLLASRSLRAGAQARCVVPDCDPECAILDNGLVTSASDLHGGAAAGYQRQPATSIK